VAQPAMEVTNVEALVPGGELLGDGDVVGMRPVAARRCTRGADGMRDDDALRGAPLRARAALDEGDDGAQDGLGGAEVTFVHAQLLPAEAHHHVAIAREPAPAQPGQSEPAQQREQLVSVLRRGVSQYELQLRGVAATAQQAGQRAKHLTGPDTKPPLAAFQTSVDTSMFSDVMLMLLTDEGRPPRIRFDTVPAVEITVPFFVCSM